MGNNEYYGNYELSPMLLSMLWQVGDVSAGSWAKKRGRDTAQRDGLRLLQGA